MFVATRFSVRLGPTAIIQLYCELSLVVVVVVVDDVLLLLLLLPRREAGNV